MKPRRILLVEINEDRTVGGSHQCLYDLARGLEPPDFEPVVLFYENNVFADRLRSLGVAVHVWDAQRRAERRRPILGGRARKLGSVWINAAAILRRAAFLRSCGIDLVHLNNSPCVGFSDWLPAARLVGRPCIAHARGGYVRPGTGLGRWLTRHFDLVIAISKHIAEDMARGGIPADRIRQIYDGIDLEAWSTAASCDSESVRAELGVDPGKMLVAMVGHLRFWKGQDVVLAALKELDPETLSRIHVVFVGDAPESDSSYQERLAATARREQLERCLTFTGHRDDVPSIMSASEVVLHASTIPEPLGLVVLEGMALGKAVIASKLGGPAEILTPETGILFDPQEPRELAEALRLLAENPVKRGELGAAARMRVRRFDLSVNLHRMREVYSGLLGDALATHER